MSSIFLYSGREGAGGRKPSSEIIRSLYPVDCRDHLLMVKVMFIARAFSPNEIAGHVLPVHEACMRVSCCCAILFPLSQRMHAFVCGTKDQDLVEGTRINLVLFLLAIQPLKELNWTVEGCLRWYHYDFRTGVVQGVPAYRLYGRESPKSN